MTHVFVILTAAAALGQMGPLVSLDSWTEGIRSPTRLSVAPDGSVWVSDGFLNHVTRFDSSGTVLGTWPVAEGPIGIADHPDGRVLVSRRDGTVGIYDAGGSLLGLLGDGIPLVTWVQPTDIAVAPSTGKIFVADSGGDRIYGFESDGNLALVLGMRGTGPSEFKYPSALAVDEARGRLIVADHDNFRIQVFDTAGLFQFRFGHRLKYTAQGDEGWTPRTQGLAVDDAGHIYVADMLMSTVRIFDATGFELDKVLTYGSNPGDLRTPCDLDLSPDGTRLYLTNTNRGTVEVYQTPTFALRSEQGDWYQGSDACRMDALRRLWSGNGVWRHHGSALISGAFDPANAFDPRLTTYDGPHMIDDPIICGRCHGIDGQPGGHVGLVEGQGAMCMSCHTAGGQALQMPVHEFDLADPYATNPLAADGQGRSHAWGVSAVNAQADSAGPAPGRPMSEHLDGGLIKCSTCHDQHGNQLNPPYLRQSNDGDAMCKECHAPRNRGPGDGGSHPVGFDYPGETGEFPADGAVSPLFLKAGNVECMTCHAPHNADSGGANVGEGDGMLLRVANDESLCQKCHTEHMIHTPGGSWQPTCNECHDVHDPASSGLSLVGRTVNGLPVVFTSRTGPNSFSDGDPAANDGICQVCHTSTHYHKQDGSGFAHNEGTACTDCHPHEAGFMPTGGSCIDCHTGAQDNGDGVPVGGRRGVVVEFPVGDVHAHYGAELTDSACTVCHSQSTHMDGNVDLIDADSGALYTFVQADSLISDPDVSDFCASCHDADGATRLGNPFDPFGNGNAAPDVAGKFQGTLQWNEWYGDFCFGEEGTLRGVNSHHDISDADQVFSGAKLECLSCHGAHTSGQTQPLIDPFSTLSPWVGSKNAFCLDCHNGGAGPSDSGFPPGVVGPTIALRGLDSCGYTGQAPWWVDYTWTHSAHGPDSKREWDGYSGAPAYDLECTACHDPHGSYSPTNPLGNPYMIRDHVDGTGFVDDGVRLNAQWTGPPWETYGVSRDVVVTISGIDVDWGAPTSLCSACHATWLDADDFFHGICNGCQTCHGHGQAWGNNDWGPAPSDSVACPLPFTGMSAGGAENSIEGLIRDECGGILEVPLHQGAPATAGPECLQSKPGEPAADVETGRKAKSLKSP